MKTLKLGRKKAHRTSLVRNLAVSLILHERITTTQSKAKLVRGYVERIINRVKKENDLNGYRVALSMLGGAQKPAKKVVEVMKKNFSATRSGFTRIIKTIDRQGDNAPMVIIELTQKTEDLLKKATDKIDEKKKTKGTAVVEKKQKRVKTAESKK
ncbi:MAG TPA: 50S ribosomal protein L17 [bacterium]|nr:50S ribosomal protein L17 [bacterium]HOR57253.1 50S ribosomal protein L17 [bacterium]